MGSSRAGAVGPGMMLALGKLSHGNGEELCLMVGVTERLATSTGHMGSVICVHCNGSFLSTTLTSLLKLLHTER